MSELKGILFDFNGVLLWDSHLHDISWRRFAENLGRKTISDEEMKHIHGRTNRGCLEYFLDRELSDEEVKKYGNNKESIYRQLCLERPDEFKLAPGAIKFLNYLKTHGSTFTIATSSEINNLKFFFEHLDLAKWFDFNLVAHDDGTIEGKPAPDLYLSAAEKLGLDPSTCLVIEDARSGIKAAHNARVGKIIALGPQERHSELAKIEGVNQTIVDFYDLLEDTSALWKG